MGDFRTSGRILSHSCLWCGSIKLLADPWRCVFLTQQTESMRVTSLKGYRPLSREGIESAEVLRRRLGEENFSGVRGEFFVMRNEG